MSATVPDVFWYGDYIQFRARLAPPRKVKNPGGFDYRKYLRHQEILYRATICERPDLILIRRGQGNPIKTAIESYRHRLQEFITRHAGSPEREIILAMTIGGQKAIPDDLQERLNQTGTSHILAISGFNIGMIAFSSVLFFQSALKIFPRLLLVWNTAKVSYALALAADLILGLSPPSPFDPSFQLSFASVAAILYIPPKLQSLFLDRKEVGDSFFRLLTRKWGRNFYLFLLVFLIATLGTLPIITYNFNSLSTVVLLANIAVIPFLGILTRPLCLLMIITYPLSETFCLLLIQGAVYLIQISVFFVNFFPPCRGLLFLSHRRDGGK